MPARPEPRRPCSCRATPARCSIPSSATAVSERCWGLCQNAAAASHKGLRSSQIGSTKFAVHVVKKKTLQDFWLKHRSAELPLRAWLKDAQAARSRTLHDIKAYARTVHAAGDNRLIFTIGRN